MKAKLKAARASTASATEKLKEAAPILTELGQDYIDLAGSLATLPPPGVTGGADYATKQITIHKTEGDLLVATATESIAALSSGDTSKMTAISKQLADLKAAKAALVPPAGISAAVLALPACAALVG